MESEIFFDKYKKKLAITFTLSIVLIILFLETFFLGFKFFDFQKWQIERLRAQANFFESNKGNWRFSVVMDSIMNNKWCNHKMSWEWKRCELPPLPPWRMMRSEDVLIFNNKNWDIISSSFNNEELEKEIVNWINKSNFIQLSATSFYYINKKLSDDINILFLSESRFTFGEILVEFFEFLILLSLFSFLFYYIIYKFVDRNLKPVEENIKNMEEFIFAAGHELKTPLAVLDSSIQLSQAKNEIWKDVSTKFLTQTKKLNSLIESLINLSTINKNDLHNEEIDISSFLDWIISNFDAKIKAKNINIKINKNASPKITASKEYLTIILNNFLSNAIKYNKDFWDITININDNNIGLKDTWIWIKAENKDKIFDRFFQENSTRNNDWFWIGLSMVQKIANIYNWKISINTEEWKGSEFILNF